MKLNQNVSSKSKNKLHTVDKNFGNFYIECPWCYELIYIEKVKCALFLHAFNTKTNRNMGPHTKRENIEKVRTDNLLKGCGGRFKLIMKNNTITPQACSY